MKRTRPYDGQPHTDGGERGKQMVEGLTMRDIRDCYIRAVFLSAGHIMPQLYDEACRGEDANISTNDLYGFDLNKLDPLAISQNLTCEIERMMGIFPNILELEETGICKCKEKTEHPGYGDLTQVLLDALEQATAGKGKERHARGRPFSEQPIIAISRLLGTTDGLAYQAVKKIQESQNMDPDACEQELLGAIIYIAAAVVYDRSLRVSPDLSQLAYLKDPPTEEEKKRMEGFLESTQPGSVHEIPAESMQGGTFKLAEGCPGGDKCFCSELVEGKSLDTPLVQEPKL